ncbi:peptidase-C39 like family protein [Rhodothermaceae bacterium RA]|nr:peptidase-C39 like family protein [Rhodothermaceae bacterium RA]
MEIRMLAQPDDVTCGPTSLHAVYDFLGLHLDLEDVIRGVDYLEEGGTLGVYLGLDALRRGFEAFLYSYNLKIFDPSWATLRRPALIDKLEAQLRYKKGKRFTENSRAYQRFLRQGGHLCFDDLTPALLHHYLDQNLPILTGLSATYLYNTRREYTNHLNRSVYDDLRGEPMGHFVVLCAIRGNRVVVADPYKENPISHDHYYEVDLHRLIRAILLGIVTYDANLLVIAPAD